MAPVETKIAPRGDKIFFRGDALRPHQISPVADLVGLLSAGQNAIDISDCGTGKTYVAAAVAKTLARPTLAVVPKITQSQWRKAAAHFDDTLSVTGYEALRTGRTPFGTWDNNPPPGFKSETWFKCQCCQREVDMDNYVPCYCHPAGVHCLETKKVPWKYGRFNFHPGIEFLIMDEVHRCGAMDSLNADMLIAAKRQGIRILGLSATAACGPLQMRALGFALGLHNLADFYAWTRRYGCGKIDGVPGWHWKAGKDRQVEFMRKLNAEIIPSRGVRVRVNDIPNFPKRIVDCRLFDLDEAGRIDALYDEMRIPLDILAKRTSRDAASDHPLTMQLRMMQKIEILKVPLLTELVPDYVAKGYSVGVFCNFQQTIDELRKRLHCDCVIDGSVTGAARDRSVERFQSADARVMLLNSEAGGVGLDLPDLTGEHPRVGLVLPPRSARTFKQLISRFHRESSKSTCVYNVLLAAGSKEVSIHNKVMAKVDNLDALNDGDFLPD